MWANGTPADTATDGRARFAYLRRYRESDRPSAPDRYALSRQLTADTIGAVRVIAWNRDRTRARVGPIDRADRARVNSILET